MPNAVSTFLETPKNGQIPKNCDNTMLFTKIAEININIYSIIIKLRIKNKKLKARQLTADTFSIFSFLIFHY